MSDFEFFERWNPAVRWVLFIPMLIITYPIVYFIGNYVMWYSLGLVGLDNDSVFGIIINGVYVHFACFLLSFIISISCAPKGKVLIASIYLGLMVFSLGFAVFSLITFGPVNDSPVWVNVYNYALNISASIFALVSTIYTVKQKKEEAEFDREMESIISG